MKKLFLSLTLCWAAQAADWPTYRADAARSGVTAEQLQLPLQSVWVHQPLHAPRPAWRGPAKRDPYNNVDNLKNRQLFDHAFHVVADAKRVYFGSSADDQVHCLDAATGNEQWSFFTEGPVRLAPTIHHGKLFFGSDDGHAYCITTEGKSVWKHRLAPRAYRIAGNNRIISAWPVRTGVLVRDGVAYAGAGMFPSEQVYVVALNIADQKEIWREQQDDLPAQGYLLLSDSSVYVPAGRSNPVVRSRANGKLMASAQGGGGTYALLVDDALVFGPGRAGHLGLVKNEDLKPDKEGDVFVSFSGNHMIVSGEKSFLHADKELSVLDRVRYLKLEDERRQVVEDRKKLAVNLAELRKQKSPDVKKVLDQVTALGIRLGEISAESKACVLWRAECAHPHALILAGNTLFAGGNDEVAAYSVEDGKQIWSAKVDGVALGLAVAHSRLFVSTDKGTIHCFTEK